MSGGYSYSRAAGHLPRDATPPELRGSAANADVGVVIVAAGSGARTGSAELKQFRWVAGKPMLLHSVHAFQRRSDVAMVVCVIPRSHVGDPPPWLMQCDLDRLLIASGGSERAESVYNGLEDLPDEVEIVVIHDGARPLVKSETIDAVIAEARRGHGAVAALPVVDTLKETDAHGAIVRTVERTGLWRAQTPQAFPRQMIEGAYVEAQRTGTWATDDAALCERLGFPVVVVPGSERAMKITEESDFARADLLATLEE
jgi:2-C-methyl-D-erythritol 4-phosphate cytidylyltransferase